MKSFNQKFLISASIFCIAAASALNASADAKQMNPKSTYPAANSELPSALNIDKITFSFPNGGETGVETINRGAGMIMITLNGSTYMNIMASNPQKVRFNPEDPDGIIIDCGLLTKGGTYTVSIPENLVTMSIDSMGVIASEDEEVEPEPFTNRAYSYSFTIVETPSFSISPQPGFYQAKDLAAFTLSFPEGAKASLVSGASQPTLYKVNLANGTGSMSASPATTYSMSVSEAGNEVNFTANDPAGIVPLKGGSSTDWYYLTVARNTIKVVYEDLDCTMPQLTFERYDVREIGAGGFMLTPTPAEGLLPADVREFKLIYPANASLDDKVDVGAVIAYLVQVGPGEQNRNKYKGYLYGTMKVAELNRDLRQIVLKMEDPEFDMDYFNNPVRMETGYYCLSILPKVFGIEPKGITYPGYGVVGKEGSSVCYVTVNVDGESTTDLTIPEGQGFSVINIEYPFEMVVDNSQGSFTLSKNGEELGSVKVSSLKIPTAGQKYFSLIFNQSFTAPGEYVLDIPGGILRQLDYGGYKNFEQKISIKISGTSGAERIEEPSALPARFAIYSLQGVLLLKDADASALQSLAPGIYILQSPEGSKKIALGA